MAKLLTGSINLSKIDKAKLFTSDKGEKFLNIAIWVNDQNDNYGNIANIQQSTKKDETKIYIGNLKEFVAAQPTQPAAQTGTTAPTLPATGSDDLPF